MRKSDPFSDHWHPAGWCSFGLYHLPAKEGTNPYSSLGMGVVNPRSNLGRYLAGNQPDASFRWYH